MRLGILSDTHGLLRPEVFTRLEGVEHILHAGDIGPADVLDALEAVAPVTAVWGNTDGWEVRGRVPEVARVELAGRSVVVIHGQQLGSPTPDALAARYAGADLIVFGHTHRSVVERVGTTLVVNPGSAGPARFRTRPSLALAELSRNAIAVEIVSLDEADDRPDR